MPQTTPSEIPPPPSGIIAFWLVLTLFNIVLIVFLVPASVLKNEQLVFIVKVVSVVGAMGAFAAGLVWFRNLALSFPRQRWFRVVNTVLLCVLIPAHVSQMPVIPVHPRIVPANSKLEIDKKPREHDGGAIWLAIRDHTVKVTPRNEGEGKPWEFSVGYKDVFWGIFNDYKPLWTPVYPVEINTYDPSVVVLIRMKDGDFDAGFRKNPPATGLKLAFEAQPELNNTFVYRGENSSTGSGDVIHLPYGEYELVAQVEQIEGCKKKVVQLSVGKGAEATADFGRLCETGN